MSNARSAKSEACPFCLTAVPAAATYCTGCHARYGYKDPHAHRNFRAWLGLLIIGLVILAAGVGVKGSGGMFGGGEGVEIVIMVGGGLAAAFGGLGTVLAGMSLGVTVMRGKMWWR
jgi:hypothetical protein